VRTAVIAGAIVEHVADVVEDRISLDAHTDRPCRRMRGGYNPLGLLEHLLLLIDGYPLLRSGK